MGRVEEKWQEMRKVEGSGGNGESGEGQGNEEEGAGEQYREWKGGDGGEKGAGGEIKYKEEKLTTLIILYLYVSHNM